MKLLNFLLCFFILSFLSAQELTNNDSYTFHWGELNDSILQVENNEFRVDIFTDLPTLKKAIDQPIFIKKNNSQIELESFGVTAYNPREGKPTKYFMVENYKPRKAAATHGNQEIGHLLAPSLELFLFSIKAKDGFSFSAKIIIGKPIDTFNPEPKLIEVPKDAIYDFQVISFEDEKTILRIDTNNKATQHIAKMYADSERYKIIHIPNFKATRRLVSEVDFIDLHIKSLTLIKNNPITDLSFYDVPEFVDYSKEDKPFILEWGEIKNVEFKELDFEKDGFHFSISENQFSTEEILDAIGNPILLSLGFHDFEILRMRLSIVPESGITTSFITDHLNYPEILKALENIPSRSVILFDEIFIKGKDGTPTFLPPALRIIVK